MSMIQFSCPDCQTQYKVPAKAAGKQATCKSCNKSMTVPMSSEGGGEAPSAFEADVVAAPVVEAGSVFAPTGSRRGGGPSPMLLAGIGGGVLVLILAVVLIVVLTKGDGDKPDPAPPVAAANPNPADPGLGRGRGRGTTPTPNTDPEGNGNGEGTTTVSGREIEAPGPALAGVRNWSLDVPAKVAGITQPVEFRGMVLSLPSDWDSEVIEMRSFVAGNSELREKLTDAFGDQVLETAMLGAGPRESSVDVSFGVMISRSGTHGVWPELSAVSSISNALGSEKARLRDLGEELDEDDFSAAILLGMVESMTDGSTGQPLAFNIFEPQTFYIKDGAFDRVEFGTLFDGHPFARVVLQNSKDDTQVLLYTGFVNDLQITFIAEAPARYAGLITDMDWLVRSARLMTAHQARSYARDDATYSQWMNDHFIEVAYAGDTTPFGGLDDASWDGFHADSILEGRSASRAVVTPLHQPYGIVPPEGMRIASVNRVAARWFPNDDGLWLQMKVTKLEGRAQRTMSTPVMSAQEGTAQRLFVNSTQVALPDGYEYSEIQAGDLTLHRVLLPEYPGSDQRRVYYVLFDGASQVTIEAYFDNTRPQDLEALDAAAQSLTKI